LNSLENIIKHISDEQEKFMGNIEELKVVLLSKLDKSGDPSEF